MLLGERCIARGARHGRVRQARPSRTRRWPICRSPGSATTISTMRRGWSPASAWPARRAATPRWQDLREIGPTFYFAPPRTFEQMLTRVMIRMEDAGALKRRLFHYFIGVARRYGEKILNGSRCRSRGRLLYAARQRPGLRAAEERARALARARRLHRRRGDRAGPVLVLPLARPEPEAALRPDRSLPLSSPRSRTAQIYSDTVGPALPNVESAHRRQRRGAVQVARHVRRLLQGRRQDRARR